MVEGELPTSRDIQSGVQQGSVLSPNLCSLYTNDTPQTPGVYLTLFADDTCIYRTDHKEGHVLRKLQSGLTAMELWFERWNIKRIRLRSSTSSIDEDWSRLILH
jgi:hypothetical protein